MQETQVQSLGWEDPLEKEMQPTPVYLPRESHGQKSLAGCSPWGPRVRHDLATEPPLQEKHSVLMTHKTRGQVLSNRCYLIQFSTQSRSWVLYLSLQELSRSRKARSPDEEGGTVLEKTEALGSHDFNSATYCRVRPNDFTLLVSMFSFIKWGKFSW